MGLVHFRFSKLSCRPDRLPPAAAIAAVSTRVATLVVTPRATDSLALGVPLPLGLIRPPNYLAKNSVRAACGDLMSKVEWLVSMVNRWVWFAPPTSLPSPIASMVTYRANHAALSPTLRQLPALASLT